MHHSRPHSINIPAQPNGNFFFQSTMQPNPMTPGAYGQLLGTPGFNGYTTLVPMQVMVPMTYTMMCPAGHQCQSPYIPQMPQSPYVRQVPQPSSIPSPEYKSSRDLIRRRQESSIPLKKPTISRPHSQDVILRNVAKVTPIPIKSNRQVSKFEKSAPLPNGYIKSLHVNHTTFDKSGVNSPANSGNRNIIKISGKVNRWRPLHKIVEEEEFEEMLYLPEKVDKDKIVFKLKTSNPETRSVRTRIGPLLNSSTFYDPDGLQDSEIVNEIENTIIVSGEICIGKNEERNTSTYRHTVSGNVNVTPEGHLSPVISTNTEMPECIASHATPPEEDSQYTVSESGCQIKLHLGTKVDKKSVSFLPDAENERITIAFNKTDYEDTGANDRTEFDLEIRQTYNLAKNKFNLSECTMKMNDDDDIIVSVPFINPIFN